MDYKVKGNQLKVRVTQDDLADIGWAMAYPIFMKFVNDNPSKGRRITSFALELRGEMILTVTSSDKAEELVVGDDNGRANV
jgi:hypothetical protein